MPSKSAGTFDAYHAGRQLNVANMSLIADIQLRHIYGNPIRQITRQAFDGERPQALFKESA